MQPLVLIELNEINFDFVKRYGEGNELLTLNGFAKRHGVWTTTSESEYENVEPWIQWVTAHTGKSLREHRILRLGDIVQSDIDQVWELVEKQGVRVGAFSPMNAANRLETPAFFVPDPWTRTTTSADAVTKALHEAVSQAVGENASGRLTIRSIIRLVRGFLRHVPARRWKRYASLIGLLRGRPWLKAVILDRLLADTFMSLMAKTRPQFASLFLNGGAHIQHHYMFNSRAYTGDRKNPTWYVPSNSDPIFDVDAAYDEILRELVEENPGARFIIATGLHQDPYPSETFYWRLDDHASFLRSAGIQFQSVEPLMSRDFIIRFDSAADAKAASSLLTSSSFDNDSSPIFEVDNRGSSLFCTLSFPRDIRPEAMIKLNGRRMTFGKAVRFVALKNGHHNPLGYLIDTGSTQHPTTIPLSDLFHRVLRHFDTATG
jgi:hypothetical protein